MQTPSEFLLKYGTCPSGKDAKSADSWVHCEAVRCFIPISRLVLMLGSPNVAHPVLEKNL